MSGQLVGEVIAASDGLRELGVSPPGFNALIAIAEKATTADRTASVRWDHIRAALYHGQRDEQGRLKPASRRSAERAVAVLLEAGVIRVVRRGFKSHGRSAAPVYEIGALPVSAILLAETHAVAPASELAEPPSGASAKSEGASAKSKGCFRQHNGVLDVSSDVSSDRARDGGRCTGSGCSICALTRKAIDICQECDGAGRRPDGPDGAPGSDCPDHGNFRQHRKRAQA